MGQLQSTWGSRTRLEVGTEMEMLPEPPWDRSHLTSATTRIHVAQLAKPEQVPGCRNSVSIPAQSPDWTCPTPHPRGSQKSFTPCS